MKSGIFTSKAAENSIIKTMPDIEQFHCRLAVGNFAPSTKPGSCQSTWYSQWLYDSASPLWLECSKSYIMPSFIFNLRLQLPYYNEESFILSGQAPSICLIPYLPSSNLFDLQGHTVDTNWQDGWEKGCREKDCFFPSPQHGQGRWCWVCVSVFDLKGSGYGQGRWCCMCVCERETERLEGQWVWTGEERIRSIIFWVPTLG